MRELVGWVRFDGDEYHDFRYARPEDTRRDADPPKGYLPAYVIPFCGPCAADVHDDCHRYDAGECGCTCTLGRRFFVAEVP